MIAIGTKAPDTLNSITDKKVEQSHLKGKRVMLFFTEWNSLWYQQMSFFNETLKYHKNENGNIDGIYVDGKLCRNTFKKR